MSQRARSISVREAEVLAGAAKGLSRQEVADQLGISVFTVKRYWENILAKLGAANQAHAIAIWTTEVAEARARKRGKS